MKQVNGDLIHFIFYLVQIVPIQIQIQYNLSHTTHTFHFILVYTVYVFLGVIWVQDEMNE